MEEFLIILGEAKTVAPFAVDVVQILRRPEEVPAHRRPGDPDRRQGGVDADGDCARGGPKAGP